MPNKYTCFDGFNTYLGSYQKWSIGNDLRDIMLADNSIKKMVGNNIYPLVAPEKVDGEFIIYGREKYSKPAVKSGVYDDECLVFMTAVSDNYDKAIALASLIDNALTGTHCNENVRIEISLYDSTETFNDNKYIETLIFKIK